uniref:Putative product n=1 Tax=Xenopsylla cheopis TaxID=163159 RepID=A0A6M2DW66_XENCH
MYMLVMSLLMSMCMVTWAIMFLLYIKRLLNKTQRFLPKDLYILENGILEEDEAEVVITNMIINNQDHSKCSPNIYSKRWWMCSNSLTLTSICLYLINQLIIQLDLKVIWHNMLLVHHYM